MHAPRFHRPIAVALLALLAAAAPAGCYSTVEELIDDLKEEDPLDRLDAVVALGEEGPEAKSAAKPIDELLGLDPNPLVRAACVRALARITGQASAEAQLRALDDKDPLVREEAVLALGLVGDQSAADRLASLLRKDPAEGVRGACAKVLGSLGGSRQVEALIKALGDRDAVVRRQAQTSLCRITCRDLGPEPEDWQAWWKDFLSRVQAPPR